MHEAPNLSLIGPMGAGKTAIGKRLAPRLGLAFVDADHALVERTGVSIAEIFEREGEAGFRAREAALLAELLAGEGVLLATGGGAVLAPANRALLAARSRVVHLRVDVRQQLRRLAHDRQRPLLQTPDRSARLQALAAERDPLYAEVADVVFDVGTRSPAQAAEALAAQLTRPTDAPASGACA